jgi:transposase
MKNSKLNSYVRLTEKQRTFFKKIIRSSSSSQGLVMRIKIILSLASGTAKKAVARELGIDKNTVKKWCKRWLAEYPVLLELESKDFKQKEYYDKIIEVFKDAPRSGIPPVFSAEQIVQIVSIACEVLDDSDRATSRWTHKEIAQEAINRNIIETISPSSVGRFLKRCSDQTP